MINNKGKKRFSQLGLQSLNHFGLANLYKNGDETQQMFLKDLVFYICKGYKPPSSFENIWLHRLILCQCHHVFPFRSSFVKQVLLIMVTKTKNLHVLPNLKFEIIISRGHWLLSNVLVTTINLIMAMKVEANPLLMGMKHLTSLMWNSNSWIEICG